MRIIKLKTTTKDSYGTWHYEINRDTSSLDASNFSGLTRSVLLSEILPCFYDIYDGLVDSYVVDEIEEYLRDR